MTCRLCSNRWFMLVASMALVSCMPEEDPPPVCERVVCEGLCGLQDDCGEVIDCGGCEAGLVCVEGVCGECVRETCATLDLACGTGSDGCGGVVQCGGCPEGYACVQGACESCARETCATLGAVCGTHSDGCGGTLECGDCSDGLRCVEGSCIPVPFEPDIFCEALAIPSSNVTSIDSTDNLVSAVRNAPAGQTLLLEAGTYVIPAGGLWFGADGVTLRSRSGDRESVILDGAYQQTSGGLINVYGRKNITIAHLTITRARRHAVHATGGPDGPSNGLLLYDLHVQDPGEQAIKLNANHGYEVDDGELACSLIELTDAGRQQVMSYEASGSRCYTGGIDAHRSRGWVVRDNQIRGFWCSNEYLSQHGVHFWRGARDTVVERNLLVDNARGIGFGLGNPGSGRTYDEACSSGFEAEHYGGIIRNNIVVGLSFGLFASRYGMDLGIGLESACDAVVAHNTVASLEAPFVSIEWRFPSTSGLILNNVATHAIRPRNEAVAELISNVDSADASWFEDLTSLELTPSPAATSLLGQGDPRGIEHAPSDYNGSPRGSPPDIGALERAAAE